MNCKWTLMGLTLILTSCSMSDDPVHQRARHIQKMKGDIVIGIAASKDPLELPLWMGMELAVKEINAAGGIMGRRINAISQNDKDSVAEALDIASSLGANLDVSAVIGHTTSYISVPASVVYEYFGIVMVSPSASTPVLTKRGLKHVFRIVPSDEETGKCMADFCLKQGYRKVMIYHVNNNYGIGLANSFQTSAHRVGVQTIDRRWYPDNSSDTEAFISDLKYWNTLFSFDAIFLAGELPHAGVVIAEARKLGINVPVLGGDGLCDDSITDIVGVSAKDIFAAFVFDLESANPVSRSFVERFTKEYNHPPTDSAAKGYDAVMVLAEAVKKGNSAVPKKIVEALHSLTNYVGVTGPNIFDEKGDVMGKPIIIMSLEDGRFKKVTDSQKLRESRQPRKSPQ
ncbi:MAG: ABC transporter substrate-binding protein [Kiritimatiellae bacterium]|nr:ABC transporter substrate-binding protein [Kiritimatiellia bacterium]MDD5521995.1 ABC transporter substrate-binding protein [Kiritimatiellia bacterium]